MTRDDVFVLGNAVRMHCRPDGKIAHPLQEKRIEPGLLEKSA
jgi:hypothetical protein